MARPAPAPTDLDAAVAAGAFKGLTEAIKDMTAGEIVAALANSGLRGRGGAGFPTSEKWRACALAPADRRYVVVHAYQSDPAVFADRVLLERNPYAVLEGAAIAAVAVGASDVIVALHAEAAEAIATLETAIREAEIAGYLGDDVLGSGRDIHVEVRPLQGAYMLGEETVLLKGIEGRRGQPEQQPPYPTTRGLYGKPTLVHNAQTFAVVPGIITGGPGTYLEAGLKGGSGTVLVQISGSVVNPGLAEVPLGTTIGEIVALAGGVPAPHTVKALLVGGPSGGILPPGAQKTPYEFEALRGGRRLDGLRLDRRRRRAQLPRRPRVGADPLLRRSGLRQDDPLPDRAAPHGRDRGSLLRGSAPRRRDRAPDRPLRRHRGQPPVRPRTPLHAAPPEPRPVLPRRARRPHRP